MTCHFGSHGGLRLLGGLWVDLELGNLVDLSSITSGISDPLLLSPFELIVNDVLQVGEVEGPCNLPLALFEAFVVSIVDGFIYLIFEVGGVLILLHCLSHLFLSYLGHHFYDRGLLLGHLHPALN